MLRFALLASVALTGCIQTIPVLSTPAPGIEVTFPDEVSQSLSSRLLLTSLEPVRSTTAGVVLCRQISVFRPTSFFPKEPIGPRGTPDFGYLEPGGEELDKLGLLANRVPQPIGANIAFSEPEAGFGPDNPWHAMIYYVEARGIAEGSEETLLEGCVCLRGRSGVSSGDPARDQLMEQSCPLVGEREGVRLPLHEVVAPEFSLSSCAADRVVSFDQGRLESPAACVSAPVCRDPSSSRCHTCLAETCSELDDLQRAPVLFELVPPVGEPERQIVMLDPHGQARPHFEIPTCTPNSVFRMSLLGRAAESVALPMTCVPSASFGRFLGASVEGEEIRDLTTIPRADGPSVVAVATDARTSSSASVSVFGGIPMTFLARIDFPGERARGIFGYEYVIAPLSGEGHRSLLAVATTSGESLKLRIYDASTNVLSELQSWTEACPNCACNQQLQCVAAPERCSCSMGLEADHNRIRFRVGDLNHDGLADLVTASDSGTAVTTHYSRRSSDHSATPVPPPFASSCQCVQLGKVPETFEVARVSADESWALAVGDGVAASIRYAEPTLAGRPCSDDQDCLGPEACIPGCPGEPERCLERCNGSCGSESCLTASSEPVCAARGLSCGAPKAFWRLADIRDLRRGRFGGALDDFVAVAAGSPVPGFDGGGFVRVFFGGDHDLSELDDDYSTVLEPQVEGTSDGPPMVPSSTGIGDWNGDGQDDVAVLYQGSEEVAAWLGSGQQAFASVPPYSLTQQGGCFPFPIFAVGDFDGNGRDDITYVCQHGGLTGFELSTLHSEAP